VIGTKLGSYEITAKLGEGGMGEVWRARDTKLERDVAIKVLPAAFVEDHERLARFEREAKLLAQLHHPNIASIFGMEESEGTKALVMELIEGPTLADRLESGAIPLNESLSLARQIAEALEEAHEKGIIHRDLKPQNIKASIEGKVKVLDFGLAKAMDPAGAASGASSASQLAASPTLTLGATQMGVVLGTAAYMSPEQAKGFAVDKRCDIWSFGVVLYEMLTGRRLFDGDSVPETLAGVLKSDVDLDALPQEVPPAIRRLLRRCLERNPKNRLHDVADARIVIDDLLSGRSGSEPTPAATVGRGSRAPWIVATAAVIVALTAIFFTRASLRPDDGLQSVMRVQLVPTRGERLFSGKGELVAVSPDGTKVVYSVESGVSSELRLRALDSNSSTAILGTEGGTNPFFSPDGRWIAFTAGAKLKKVALAGGMPVTLADAPYFRGGVWGDDGTIYFVPNIYVPIARIPAGGGTAEPATTIRLEAGEQQHRWPDLLPGGKVLLYAVGSGDDWDDATIVAERLGTGEREVVVKGGTNPRFLAPGALVYARADGLYAVAFDPRTLATSGPPVEVASNVALDRLGGAQMDFARTGLLASVPADSVVNLTRVSWVGRDGQGEALSLPPAAYDSPRISPTGDRAVLSVGNSLSILDFERLALTRLTLARRAEAPVWANDGRRVYFAYEEGKTHQVFSMAADDSGAPELVIPSDLQNDPYAFSRDGSKLLVERIPASGIADVLIYDLGNPKAEAKRLFGSLYLDDGNFDFSPDDRWVVYASAESGRLEVYVRSASGQERKWQVSVDGGTFPVWSPAGGEIFFLRGTQMMVASVSEKGDGLLFGEPKVLFANHRIRAFDVSRDGRRFLVAEDPNSDAQSRLDLVLNWTAEVRRKVAEAHAP